MDTNKTRRRLLRASGAGLLLACPVATWAAELATTPRQSTGPFYPNQLPLDDDNDLVQITGREQSARGTVTHMHGQVLDVNARPIPNARVEIWQCDANGRYHHERDNRDAAPDPGFQGFGHNISNANGEYRFRTIKPVAYPGRTPHIHYKVIVPGAAAFTTQMYVAGEPQNTEDFLYRRLGAQEREQVTVALKPNKTNNEFAGRFDIVVGS